MASKGSRLFIFIVVLLLNIDFLICLIRGKQTGHDVDFLITHPILGEEKELLTKIIEVLGFYLRLLIQLLFIRLEVI